MNRDAPPCLRQLVQIASLPQLPANNTMMCTAQQSFNCISRETRKVCDAPNLNTEVWSPNSSQIPSYPGVRPDGSNWKQCPSLSDGRRGPYDPGFYPQCIQDANLYYAFFPRPPTGSASEQLKYDPEFAPLRDYWIRDELNSAIGRASKAFADRLLQKNEFIDTIKREQLCRLQCISLHPDDTNYPTQSNIKDIFQNPKPFEVALDEVGEIQLAMKRKRAFFSYYAALEAYSCSERPISIGAAKETKMGCWANALSQHSLELLLHSAIPVFFTRNLDIKLGPFPSKVPKPQQSSVQGDDQNLPRLPATCPPNCPPPPILYIPDRLNALPSYPSSTCDNRVHGTTSYFAMQKQRQTFLPRFKQSNQASSSRQVLQDCDQEEHDENQKHFANHKFKTDSDTHQESESLHSPPNIQSVTPGTWTTWTSTEPDKHESGELGLMRCVQINKVKAKALVAANRDLGTVYYDRVNRRILVFHRPPPHGDYGSIQWGISCNSAGVRWSPNVTPTIWMYATKDPSAGYAGMKYPQNAISSFLHSQSHDSETPLIHPRESPAYKLSKREDPGYKRKRSREQEDYFSDQREVQLFKTRFFPIEARKTLSTQTIGVPVHPWRKSRIH